MSRPCCAREHLVLPTASGLDSGRAMMFRLKDSSGDAFEEGSRERDGCDQAMVQALFVGAPSHSRCMPGVHAASFERRSTEQPGSENELRRRVERGNTKAN